MHWTYRLMCLILYGDEVPGLSAIGNRYFSLQFTEMGSHFKVRTSRLREYLQECERLGMIDNLKLSRGLGVFRLIPPPNLDISK